MDPLWPPGLFVNAPNESISFIWQVFGCQHTLQPTENDYEAPTVPSLTPRGFVRWQSIQILLEPEEHVPYILFAVKNWDLKNPDTGEPFPKDISTTAFPAAPDPDITAWHAACGEKLRKEATPKASPRPTFPSAADRMKDAYSHVPAPDSAGSSAGRPRPANLASDYFNHRPPFFTHVSPGHTSRYPRGAPLRVSPERMERARRNGSSAEDIAREERARRRSFSDYPSPQEQFSSVHLHPGRTVPPRRHSHPRRGFSSDESGSEADMSPRSRRSSGHHAPPARGPKVATRYAHVADSATPSPGIPPLGPGGSPAVQVPSVRTDRADGGVKIRPDGRDSPVSTGRRKSAAPFEGAKDWAKDKFDKFSTILPIGSDKPPRRNVNSSGSGTIPIDRIDRLSKDSLPGASKVSRSWSYDDQSGSDSEERDRRRRRRLRDRERDRREREREAYERERDRPPRRSRDAPPDWDDVDPRDKPRSRKEKEARYLRRPENPRRTSSHADVDRYRHEAFDLRDRERYGAERDRRRRGGSGYEERDRDRDRDRDRERERATSPEIKGVSGRRYPTEPAWAQDE